MRAVSSATLLVDDFRSFGVRERCAWHFDHLGEALDAESRDGLSVLASRPSRSVDPRPVTAALNRGSTLAPASRLAFVYRRYRTCIAVDATRWLYAPHGGDGAEWRAGWELLASKMCALLRSAARGFGVDVDNQVPADAVRFRPDVLLSIIIVARPQRDPRRARRASAAPRDDSSDVHVLAQGVVLNSTTLPAVERTVRAGLRRFEVSAAVRRGRRGGGGGRPSTARASASSVEPPPTRRARGALASCINHGRVALELMPTAAAPLLVIFTDGSNTLGAASRQAYDSHIMQLSRADIALSFVHVAARLGRCVLICFVSSPSFICCSLLIKFSFTVFFAHSFRFFRQRGQQFPRCWWRRHRRWQRRWLDWGHRRVRVRAPRPRAPV